jgi:hypothetical protein
MSTTRQEWLEAKVAHLELELLTTQAQLRVAEERAFNAEAELSRAAQERHPSGTKATWPRK